MIIPTVILVFTYIGISSTRLPWVNIDRTSAAFTGAVLMVLLGVLTFPEAVTVVDFNTLALLLGMMLLVAVLNQAGFFSYVAAGALSVGNTPHKLLVLVVVATGALSAFLVNDAVVLLFTPVVLQAARLMKTNPLPFLIAEAMASNIGSTATMVGNPQNMLIGLSSGISFGRFFAYLLPVAVISSAALILIIFWAFRKDLRSSGTINLSPLKEDIDHHPHALRLSVPILALTMIAFFLSTTLGLSLPLIALVAGAVVLLIGHIKPSEVIAKVDWGLLVFFGGLFVVIGGARQAGILDFLFDHTFFTPDPLGMVNMHLFSAGGSQVVSNVPMTMLTIPLIQHIPSDRLWISLAAGATLGGNLTLIGAVANLIVAEVAARQQVEMGFKPFLRIGLLVTPITLALSILILILESWAGFLA